MMKTEPADVLLAEDNESDMDLAMRILNRADSGKRIHCVRDGAEALEFVFATGRYADRDKKRAPAVILLDLKMPKVDGLEVLRRIRNDERTKAIPVVMLTSSQEKRDLLESYKSGVNGYVVKPVDPNHFEETMTDVGRFWFRCNQPPPRYTV